MKLLVHNADSSVIDCVVDKIGKEFVSRIKSDLLRFFLDQNRGFLQRFPLWFFSILIASDNNKFLG